MATAQQWWAGARPLTLPAAASPVIVGSAAAAQLGSFRPAPALLALALALLLQIGVNYANDYSDGIRGTDLDRVGPTRLTAAGLAPAGAVKRAAFACFGLGALAGLALVVVSGHWWLLAVGVLSIAAAWGYTGGKNPYGYRGMGEVAVFIFFGLVATLGTTYTQADRLSVASVLGAVAIGLFACAILMANNIRDIPTDIVAGKRTLAVRLGDRRARRTYVAMIWIALLLGVACVFTTVWALLVLLLLAPLVFVSLLVLSGAKGPLLIPVLRNTGRLQLGFAILLGAALVLGA